MIKKNGISGGFISINNVINPEARKILLNLKIASSNFKEAAKEGLQSLYADPDELLKRYKDFDIVKAISERNGELLWIRARAIDADTVNANGDSFSKEELLKKIEYKGEKIPAYKTFEGCPVYTNHKNDDIEEAKGMIVYSEWDEENNCVWVTLYIDEKTYPYIARGIRQGYMKDVSMGCFPTGTQVLTDKGYRSIETINLYDKLVDAKGELTDIKNKQIRDYCGDLIGLDVEGGIYVESTTEHPYLIFEKETFINRKKRVGVGKNRKWIYSEIKPVFKNACELKEGDFVLFPINSNIKNKSELNINKARILGYFLAEGSFIKTNGERREVEFNFALDEKDTLVQETANLIEKEFGLKSKIYTRENRHTCNLRINSKDFADWIYQCCGEFSNNKSLFSKVLFENSEIQKHIIGSWISGDGYLRKIPSHPKSNNILGWTTSRELLKQNSIMLNINGIYHKKYAVVNGKHQTFTNACKLSNNYVGENGKKIAYYIDIPSGYSHLISDYANFDGIYSQRQQNNHCDDYIVHKISNITRKSFNGKVYNFETKSHSYIVEDCIVHNCQVEKGKCSHCGHIAESEKDYCECLKEHKGKTHPKDNKKVYEDNYGLKFIELSIVGDGAFDKCEIAEIFDADDILNVAFNVEKKANTIHNNIILAGSYMPKDIEQRQAYEECLRQTASTTNYFVKFAQTAGNLVGGQYMAAEGAGRNATVGGVLKFLGMDPNAGLNILDLLNLGLNFLEVAVMNLFARKDSIDLGHVGKITKAMADLQATMQDMIDDGIDIGPGVSQGTPINTQQVPPVQTPTGTPQEYNPVEGGIGKQIGPAASMIPPSNVAPAAFMVPEMISPYQGVGGGAISASKKKSLIIWANDKEGREVFASTNNDNIKPDKMERLTNQILTLGKEVGFQMPQTSKNDNTGGLNKMSDNRGIFGKRFASQRRLKEASQVVVDFTVQDTAGHKVTLSSDGEVKAFKNGQQIQWEPRLSEDQINKIDVSDSGAAEIADELLKEFKVAMTDKRNVVAWQEPKTPTDVQENQLGAYTGEAGKRRNNPEDVQENQLENGPHPRKGNPDDVQENQLGKGKGYSTRGEGNNPDDVQEHQIETNSGLYGRKVTDKDDDVKENLLEDARTGCPDDVQENQLAKLRAEKSNSTPNDVMASVTKRLARTVESAMITPDEALEEAKIIAERKDLIDLIALARMGNKTRRTIADRREYHNIAPVSLTITAALLDQFGKEKKISVSEFAEGLKVAVKEDKLTIQAMENHVDKKKDNKKYNVVSNTISKKELLKVALSNESESKEEVKLDRQFIVAALSSMVKCASELGINPEEVVNSIDSISTEELRTAVELNKLDKSVKERVSMRNRKQFWGTVKVAGKEDIDTNIIGWLADYSIAHKIPTNALVKAAKRVCREKEAAVELVSRLIEKEKNKREAAVTVTDEKTTTKRIVCRAEELGLDVKDENFEQVFRDKAIEVLTNSGFTVDPETFSMTDLTVTEGGDVTASVTSRFSKTFSVEPSTAPVASVVPEEKLSPDVEVQGEDDTMMTPQSTMTNGENIEEPETLMSQAATEYHKTIRKAMVEKYAQIPGMGGPPAAGGMGGPGGAAPGGGAMTGMNPAMGTDLMAAGDETGISALTGGGSDEVPNPVGDTDTMPEPGNKKPWGTICPQCGSTDVDVANGDGNCRSCGAQLEFSFNVVVKPENDKDKTESGGTGAGELGIPGPEDVGLGAATAPAPAPMGGMGGPGAPVGGAPAAGAGVLAQVTWVTDPDVFVRLAQDDFDREKTLALPVGFVCPACGNREADKHKNKTYCKQCGTISISKIASDKGDDTKVRVSIKWL